jgi:hypothetical protein
MWKNVDMSNVSNMFAQDYLENACEEGDVEMVERLLKDSRVDPSLHLNHCFNRAFNGEHLEVLKLLLADPRVHPQRYHNVLIGPAADGDVEIVKLLLSCPRVDPSINNDETLKVTILYDQVETMMLLLADPRVDPAVAITLVHVKTASLLIKHEKFGFEHNEQLYRIYQPRVTAAYLEACERRAKRVQAAIWSMHCMNDNWIDIIQIVKERLEVESLVFDKTIMNM